MVRMVKSEDGVLLMVNISGEKGESALSYSAREVRLLCIRSVLKCERLDLYSKRFLKDLNTADLLYMSILRMKIN